MRIAILVPNFSEFSGDARVAEMQVEDFIRKGDDVSVFALEANIKPKKAQLVVLGMPESLFWQRVYRLIFPIDIIKTIKYTRKLKEYDMVVSHLYPMNWLACLAKYKYNIDYTYWYHGIPSPKLYPNLHEKLYLILFIILTKYTIGNADRIISVSRAASKELKRYTGFNSSVIYNKPDLHRFHGGLNGSEIKKNLGIGDDPVILNVGRVCPQKGAHLLIKSFALVQKKIPDAKLVIVGKQTYDYYMKGLKENCNDSVIFAGYVPDQELPKYYAMCDIYATCSLWEANNVPVLEAQACGKPVIAFNFEFFEEEVNTDGTLVEAGNIDKFADACINKLIQLTKK